MQLLMVGVARPGPGAGLRKGRRLCGGGTGQAEGAAVQVDRGAADRTSAGASSSHRRGRHGLEREGRYGMPVHCYIFNVAASSE